MGSCRLQTVVLLPVYLHRDTHTSAVKGLSDRQQGPCVFLAVRDGGPLLLMDGVCVRVALTNCLLMILFTDHHPAHKRRTVGRDMRPPPAPPLCLDAAPALGSFDGGALKEKLGATEQENDLCVCVLAGENE